MTEHTPPRTEIYKKTITARKYDTMRTAKYEWRGAVSPALAVVRRRRRSPDMATIKIPLSSRKYPGLHAIVDDGDAPLVSGYSWFPKVYKSGRQRIYALAYCGTSREDNRYVLMHHLIVGLPPNGVVDHKDGDGLNNTRSNLRFATFSQNVWNQRLKVDNLSGFKGIRYHKRDKRWVARIKVNYREIRIGAFITKEEAARAYDRVARELHGEFALTNEMLGLLDPEVGDE